MITTAQNAKMLRYSREEMLKEWKLRKGFTEGRKECEIVRDDGIDLDSLLLREIDGCYSRLLAEAPLDYLPVADITDDVEVAVAPDMVATIVVPEDCVRLVEVRFPSWQRSVEEIFPADSDMARRQQSPWLRGGSENPVCVATHRGIRCYTVSDRDEKPSKLLAVSHPAATIFLFAESAWQQLLSY